MTTVPRRRSLGTALLLVGLLATACTSSDDSSSPADPSEGEDTTATTASGGTESESGPTTTVAPGETTTSWDPTATQQSDGLDLAAVAPMLLIQFGQAWADANWKAMAAVADGEVVATATDEHVDGAEPPVDGDNVAAVIESCQARLERNTWSCALDYGADGSTTTFAMDLEQTPEGLRITSLAADGG